LVAARSARRVTSLDLATALRDRDGSPYGRRWYQRLSARLPTGGLVGRLAIRANLQRPARTLAVTAQIAAAVGAAFLVPTLISSVNEFNSATQEPWVWESVTTARDPGLPFDATATSAPPTDESGVWVEAELADDEVYVYGLDADTDMFVPTVDGGRWFEAGTRQAVVSRGFAEHRDLTVGEPITLGLASGPVEYDLVGTVDDHSVALYVDKNEVATDLGSPGMANVVWSDDAAPASELSVATSTSTAADLAEEDEAARSAIVAIFGAIGAIVAGVAALAVASSMGVSLFERRHELAALQAIGARRRKVRGVVLRELVPVGLAGTAIGVAAGAYGADLIIGSFEAGDGIDIGVTYAWTWVPIIAVGTAILLALVATAAVRSAARRPIAVTLRSAA
jgi:putative ABC transport system permease protein